MALIFPNICRFTVVGEYLGQDCMNIVDVQLEDVGPGAISREEAIFACAGDILNNWDDHVLPLVVSAYQAIEVRWVDLATANGTTGSRSETDENSWPVPGGNPGAGLPGNTYAKVVKRVAGKNRLQRNGALRLGAIPEAGTITGQNNTLVATFVDEVNTAFENFKDGIQDVAELYQRNLGVLHTVNQVATGWSDLSEFACASTVGTLRRRMPGYGS